MPVNNFFEPPGQPGRPALEPGRLYTREQQEEAFLKLYRRLERPRGMSIDAWATLCDEKFEALMADSLPARAPLSLDASRAQDKPALGKDAPIRPGRLF